MECSEPDAARRPTFATIIRKTSKLLSDAPPEPTIVTPPPPNLPPSLQPVPSAWGPTPNQQAVTSDATITSTADTVARAVALLTDGQYADAVLLLIDVRQQATQIDSQNLALVWSHCPDAQYHAAIPLLRAAKYKHLAQAKPHEAALCDVWIGVTYIALEKRKEAVSTLEEAMLVFGHLESPYDSASCQYWIGFGHAMGPAPEPASGSQRSAKSPHFKSALSAYTAARQSFTTLEKAYEVALCDLALGELYAKYGPKSAMDAYNAYTSAKAAFAALNMPYVVACCDLGIGHITSEYNCQVAVDTLLAAAQVFKALRKQRDMARCAVLLGMRFQRVLMGHGTPIGTHENADLITEEASSDEPRVNPQLHLVVEVLVDSAAAFKSAGKNADAAACLYHLGVVYWHAQQRDKGDAAVKYLNAARAAYAHFQNKANEIALCDEYLGHVHKFHERFELAASSYQAASEGFNKAPGTAWRAATCARHCMPVYFKLGKYEMAARSASVALVHYGPLGSGKHEVGECNLWLGRIHVKLGKLDEAEGYLRKAREVYQSLQGAPWQVKQCDVELDKVASLRRR